MELPGQASEEKKEITKPVVVLIPEIPTSLDAADKELLEASAEGNLQRVQSALIAKPNLNTRDGLKRTPLFIAAANGHETIVRLLLESGALLEATDNDGATPLHRAAFNGQKDVVRLLLEKGANREPATKEGCTPLYIAAYKGHEEVVKLLLNNHANIEATADNGSTPLYAAASCGHAEVVRLLLGRRAHREAATIKTGDTPLHIAAILGRATIVRLLLEKGANVNARNKEGETPLMHAALFGHMNVALELLAHPHITVNATNPHNRTALELALTVRHFSPVAQLLYRYGAEDFWQQQNRDTFLLRVAPTSLQRAAATGNLEIIENNLKTNPSHENINQALAYATCRGHTVTVNRILQAGADPHEALQMIKIFLQRPSLNREMRIHYQAIKRLLIERLPSLKERILESPALHSKLIGRRFYELPQDLRAQCASREEQLIRAVQDGRIEEVHSALQSGADPNARDTHGDTALWVAALTQKNPEELIQLLLQHGADPTIPNIEGHTLIQWVANRQNAQLFRKLLVFGARAPEQIVRTYLVGSLVPVAALGHGEEVLNLLTDPTIALPEAQEALLYATAQGHVPVVEILLITLGTPQLNALQAVQAILKRRGLSVYDAVRYQEIERMLSAPPELRDRIPPSSLHANIPFTDRQISENPTP